MLQLNQLILHIGDYNYRGTPGKIEIGNVPEPSPGRGEVLLRIVRIGVCGSAGTEAAANSRITGLPPGPRTRRCA